MTVPPVVFPQASFLPPGCFPCIIPLVNPPHRPWNVQQLSPLPTGQAPDSLSVLCSRILAEMHIFWYPTFLAKNAHRTFLEDEILHPIMSATGSSFIRLTLEPSGHLSGSQKHSLSWFHLLSTLVTHFGPKKRANFHCYSLENLGHTELVLEISHHDYHQPMENNLSYKHPSGTMMHVSGEDCLSIQIWASDLVFCFSFFPRAMWPPIHIPVCLTNYSNYMDKNRSQVIRILPWGSLLNSVPSSPSQD